MRNRSDSPLTQCLVILLALFIASPVSMAQVAPSVQEAYYPTVIHTQGDVKVLQSPDVGQPKKWMKVKKGMKIRPGARIKTMWKSQLDLGVKDKYEMRIKEKSDVIAGSLAFNTNTRQQKTQFKIKKGSIYNRIQEGYLGTFTLDSPTVDVTAIGTEYAVDVWGPQNEVWVGSAMGALEAVDKLNNETLRIPKGYKLEMGTGEADSGEVVPLPDYELQGLQRELDKIGTGADEDLDVRAYFILPYSTQRVRQFLAQPALITNTNEPRRLQQLFIPTVQMLQDREDNEEAILKNLGKIDFVCDYYKDDRFSPQFLSFAAVLYNQFSKHKTAIKIFKKVLKNYPKFQYASIVQCAIAIIYEENLKDNKKAKKAYKKVLDNYPDSLEAEIALDALSRLAK